jgi:hypothetical protein
MTLGQTICPLYLKNEEPKHQMKNRIDSSDINVLALVKGEERYIFLFDDAGRTETLRTLGRFASNQELSFSWYDAAVLSKRIRDLKVTVQE